MASKTIADVLKRLAILEQEESAPGAKAEHGEIRNLGGNLNIQKLNVKGGNDTNLEVGSVSSKIEGLDGTASGSNTVPNESPKAVTLNTGCELLEAEGDEDEEAPTEEPDFGGEDADLDSELGEPFSDEEAAPEAGGEAPVEGGGDDDLLAQVDALLRAALGDDSLSVSIGVNMPKGGGEDVGDELDLGAEGGEEELAMGDEETGDHIEDATVATDDLGLEDEYGEDRKTMESFLKDIGSEKKNLESDESDEDGECEDGESGSDCGPSPMGY